MRVILKPRVKTAVVSATAGTIAFFVFLVLFLSLAGFIAAQAENLLGLTSEGELYALVFCLPVVVLTPLVGLLSGLLYKIAKKRRGAIAIEISDNTILISQKGRRDQINLLKVHRAAVVIPGSSEEQSPERWRKYLNKMGVFLSQGNFSLAFLAPLSEQAALLPIAITEKSDSEEVRLDEEREVPELQRYWEMIWSSALAYEFAGGDLHGLLEHISGFIGTNELAQAIRKGGHYLE